MLKNLGIDLQKLTLALLVGAYFIYCSKYPTTWHIVDSFDLVIHEAGHTIMRFAGEFMHFIGGSLFQILIPLLFIGYFFLKKDFYSSSILTPWLGYNLINVSIYIRDSISMTLPLLGGDGVIHDWNWILSTWGLLSKTYTIANIVSGLGFLIVTIGFVTSLYFSRKART